MSGPLTRPALLVRLEGLAVLLTAVALYWAVDGSWVLFGLLILVPDLSLLGYLASKRVGAATYNLIHTMLLPLGLGLYAIVAFERWAGLGALIWLAHLGIDRAAGFGLKYPSGFKDTHLGRL